MKTDQMDVKGFEVVKKTNKWCLSDLIDIYKQL